MRRSAAGVFDINDTDWVAGAGGIVAFATVNQGAEQIVVDVTCQQRQAKPIIAVVALDQNVDRGARIGLGRLIPIRSEDGSHIEDDTDRVVAPRAAVHLAMHDRLGRMVGIGQSGMRDFRDVLE